MATALSTLVDLVARLKGLEGNPTATTDLYEWIAADGMASLKPGLLELVEAKIQPNTAITQETRLDTLTPPPSWEALFQGAQVDLKLISDRLIKDNRICVCHYVPDTINVFRAFILTPLPQVRVVIIGQDPYHTIRNGRPIADGLAFSVPIGITIPPSLRNIFNELKREFPTYQYPTNGSLDAWAKQGVLLLNAALTTMPGVAGAHTSIWFQFILKVLTVILIARPNTIFVLWGNDAKRFKRYLGGARTLEAAHPVAFSGFAGNNHFLIINKLLAPHPINWQT